MSKYKAIITTAGADRIAAANAGGTQLKITKMAVGDGNGTLPLPHPEQVKLVNEKYRAALNGLTIDKTLKNHIVAELIIPASVGGFWLREMGLYDDAGTLIAVSNIAESYKPMLAEGSGRTQTLRMVLIVSSSEAIQVIASGDTIIATKDFVVEAITDHAKSHNHPDASTTDKGFVQLSSATNSASETLAATPKAVKAVNDAAVKLTQNLDDLPDKAKARANLGLKSAALCETGEAAGQVLTANKAFGLGLMQPERRHKLADLGGANGFTGFTWSAVSDPDTPPIATSVGIINHAWRPSDTAAPYVLQLAWRQGRAAFRTKDSNMDFQGWSELLHTGNAYTAAQSDGKYALRSIKVNGKPLSADVNLLAGDVNAWNKTEADDRYLMRNGGQLSGIVKTSAEIQSTSQNNYRITSGNYGTFWRQDGTELYLLMTNAGDQLGSYSSHRPFAVSMATGGVTLGTQMTLTDANFVDKMGFSTYTDGAGKAHRQANGLRLRVADTQLAEFYYNETVGHSAEVSLHNKYGTTDSYFSLRNDGLLNVSGVNPQINLSSGTIFAKDGNVHGSVWGGYLSNFISKAVDGRVDWNSFNNRSHVAGSRQAWLYKDELTGFIFQGGVVERGAGYLTWVGFPRGYTQDCFGVQLTLAGHWGDSNMNVEAQSLSAGGFNAAMGENERVVFWWAVGV